MGALPDGRLTLVFTDVEGSTQLLHQLGESYAEVLADHRRTLREAFARHNGTEVDTQGDAFFYVFASADDALAAAGEGCELLESGPVHVRIGVHTGAPQLTSEGYVGTDIHLAARIGAVGSPPRLRRRLSRRPSMVAGRCRSRNAAAQVGQTGSIRPVSTS